MKTTQEIYEQLRDAVAEKSGYVMEDTCDLAVRLYAAAAQLESLYAYADWTRRQAFPQSAAAEQLEQHAALWGLSRTAARHAAGTLRLYVPQALGTAVTVAAGSVFATAAGVRYALDADCTIAAGSTYGDAAATCLQAGSMGNAPSGAICVLTEAPNYISAVRNLAAFTGGTDAEDDESLRHRLLGRICRMPNGANAAYYEAVALGCTNIRSAKALPRYGGIGTVGLCVANREGGLDQREEEEIYEALEERAELGITIGIFPPTLQAIDVSVNLFPVDGVADADAIAAVEAEIAAYFAEATLGDGFFLSQLGSRIYQTGMVKNYVFALPMGDYDGADTVLITPGEISVQKGQ